MNNIKTHTLCVMVLLKEIVERERGIGTERERDIERVRERELF
jgi:hypothetical protein